MRITSLKLDPLPWLAMRRHAEDERPNECCGFLVGERLHELGWVREAIPLVNELASPTAFRTEARSVLNAFRQMRATEQELLAIYHSHPSSEPIPSQRDLRDNTYGDAIPWLIIGPDGEMRAWSLRESDYSAIELNLPPSETNHHG